MKIVVMIVLFFKLVVSPPIMWAEVSIINDETATEYDIVKYY